MRHISSGTGLCWKGKSSPSSDDDNEKLAVRWEGDGKTVVFFAGENRVLALIAIADKSTEGELPSGDRDAT